MNALPIILSATTFVSTTLGGLFALRHKDRLHRILGFTAGVLLGVGGLSLNLRSLRETHAHGDRLHWGYLVHFLQDSISSLIIIATGLLAYLTQWTDWLLIGAGTIVVLTLILGLVGAFGTILRIHHSENEHRHDLEPAELHRYHAKSANP